MNILVDHHHGALLRSMYYLFKKRLGFNVYVPTGFEWLDEGGLYSCYPNRDTANQMLNSWVHDPKYKEMFLPLTFDEFKEKNIDIAVASLWENHSILDSIIKKYSDKTKLILQVGNNIPCAMVEHTNAKNLLSSAYPTYLKSNLHKVFYHQEFGLEYFHPTNTDINVKSVTSFKHIMEDEFELIQNLERKLPDWNFKCYGALNRDGIISDRESDMSTEINKVGFIFHVKKDDGYGHVIHTAFACGKPMIVNLDTAKVVWGGESIQNTASFLYDVDTTVINSNDSIDIISDKLKMMADDYPTYTTKVYEKFKQIVDFDKEESEIRNFIENLI